MDNPLLQENQIFSVSQITEYIQEILESTFRGITIEGEISNWRPSLAGHIYFTLKDSNSQIKAVLFKGNTYNLTFKPKDGDKVRCTGNLSVYGPQGTYQLIVNKMEPVGAGNILQMLEERKRKLYAEGLFDETKKRSIPKNPDTIGVVTSPTGAAIRDILQITKRRNKNINIIIFPAIVQGNEAAETIVNMIETANFYKMCDILIIGRGGGSLEDLLPFSEESVVRAIANSEIPTISAVGHEIDWALSDYAADVRAATPSAAAELSVPLLSDIKQNISNNKNELYNSIKQILENKRLLIKTFTPESLEVRFRNIQQPLLNRFANCKENLILNMQEKIKDLRIKIKQNVTILENASPETIFKRGYSMVKNKKTGEIIRNSKQVIINDEIEIIPAEGKISAIVNKTE